MTLFSLNRASWLREDGQYLQKAYRREDARFVILNRLDPLVQQHSDHFASIARLERSDIADHLPDRPFEDVEAKGAAVDVNEQDDKPLVVFLGVEEEDGASLPAREAAKPLAPPIFAVDLSTREASRNILLERPKARFISLRTQVDQLSMEDAGLAAQARSLVDWNRRNRFCPGCGRPVVPIWGGYKRTCRSVNETPPCPSSGRVQNYVYPRTDSVVIVCILHPTEDKILLGRQRVWPSGFFSCLAGFVEPAETLEEATIREIYEEAGVKVRNVRYLRSQPWPFPNSLMCGMIAEAEHGAHVRTDLDNELESAEWYDRATVLRALEGAKGFSQKERDHIDKNYGDKLARKLDENDAPTPSMRLPPKSAIAHHLIKLARDGPLHFDAFSLDSQWATGEVSRTLAPHM